MELGRWAAFRGRAGRPDAYRKGFGAGQAKPPAVQAGADPGVVVANAGGIASLTKAYMAASKA